MILYFNFPLVFGMPLFYGLTDYIDDFGEKMEIYCKLLLGGEVFIALTTFGMYQILRKAVTKVTYKVDTDEFIIVQCSAFGLRQKTYMAKRKELAKIGSINPLVDFFRL